MSTRRPYAPRRSTEERRAQLLDAALELIGRDGYGAVSIDAIAREVGVTRPVVYRVFDDLDALLFALLDRQEERALARLLSAISPPTDLTDLDAYLAHAIGALVEMVREEPETWGPILLADGSTPRAVRRRIDRDRDLVRGRIQALVGPALAGRPGTEAVDPDVVAHALVAIAEHFGRRLLEAPDEVDTARLTATIGAVVSALRR